MDEFETAAGRTAERKSEIERIRENYGHHREALVRMVAEAPSQGLAAEYQRIIRVIDDSVAKLNQLDSPVSATLPGTTSTAAQDFSRKTLSDEPNTVSSPVRSSNAMRTALILIVAVLAIAVFAFLVQRSRHKNAGSGASSDTIVTESSSSTSPARPIERTTTPPVSAVPATPASVITVTPASADFGVIRKGTRAVRQFQLVNHSDSALDLFVERSTCHCLFYEYGKSVAAKGKETITVAVDGARVRNGVLNETVKITSKKDPNAEASFQVLAKVK